MPFGVSVVLAGYELGDKVQMFELPWRTLVPVLLAKVNGL
jgi:hypothetical protein